MPLEILTPPAVEPVDLTYAKTFLRVDNDAEDALITDLITAARFSVEALCGQAMITRDVRQMSELRGEPTLSLSAMPVQDIIAVRTVDSAGNETVLPAEGYALNPRCTPPRLTFTDAGRLALAQTGAERAVIDYRAGFADAPAGVPMPLRQALLLLLAQSYEHRGDEADRPVPMMVDALLMPYRWMKL